MTDFQPEPEPLPAQVKVETLGAGTTVPLTWPATDALTFVFDLIYDANGNFSEVMLTVEAPSWGLPAQAQKIPVQINTTSKTGQTIEIVSQLTAGGPPYAGAIWVKADAPDFIFEGEAVQFSATAEGPPPYTIW